MKHVAEDLGISQQTIYNWRREHLIYTGERLGLISAENVELASAKRRVRDLEEEAGILVGARELFQEVPNPRVASDEGSG